ncbi:hypothetical protein BGZ72_007949 [Mortierella alpina]|nr:hypothetical protein BGZ72_007949 [Mortierella alpina]
MRQSRNTCKKHSARVLSIGVVLLIVASLSSAKPSAIDSTSNPLQNAVDSKVASSSNIIHSIGFLPCSASSVPSSPGSGGAEPDGDEMRLDNLALLYDLQSNMIMLRADGSSKVELDATSAHIVLHAYDRVLYDQMVGLDKLAPLAPQLAGRFSIEKSFPAPALLPSQLPKQLFSVPAVEALAMIQLYDSHDKPILCASVPMTNTVSAHSSTVTIASVSLTAVAVALTLFTGVLAAFSSAAALTSMPLSILSGAGAKGGTGATAAAGAGGHHAPGLSPSVWDVVSFCQFIVMSGSLNLEYPALLRQWTANFGWSMGLVQAESWNRAIEHLRSRTTRPPAKKTAGQEEQNSAAPPSNSTSTTTGNNVNTNSTQLVSAHTASFSSADSQVDQALYGRAIKVHGAEGALYNTVSSRAIGQALPHQLERRQVAPIAPVPATPPSAVASVAPAAPAAAPLDTGTAPSSPATAPSPPLAPAVPAAQLAAPPPTSPPISPAPPPQIGAQWLPSVQDNSLMNRPSDLSSIKPLDTSFHPPSTTNMPWSGDAVAAPPSPPSLRPQDDSFLSSPALGPPGFPSFGQQLHIPANNLFMTSLFLFLILLLTTSLLALVVRASLEVYAHIRPGKFTKLRRRFSSYYLGSMLRVMLLAYFAVATLAFYQLTLADTWFMTLIAVLTLLSFIALVSFISLRLWRADGTSLFFDERLKSKYGVLYDQYLLSTYWFFIPVLAYQILKAAIVGLGQGRGFGYKDSMLVDGGGGRPGRQQHGSSDAWAQTSLLLLVEVLFAALMIWKRPFADRAPNRLNAVLGCVRVLNVVMLAVLIESTAVSTVSRAVVGMVIMGTQAVVMLVIGCLVFYQLGQVLWRVWSASKANKKNKDRSSKTCLFSLSKEDEEMVIVSVTDDQRRDRQRDEDDEYPRRMAGEHKRAGEADGSSVLGKMGSGSNPTICCTPASDDEASSEEEGNADEKTFENVEIIGRYRHGQGRRDSLVSPSQDEELEERIGESNSGSNRDSTNSHGSDSSHILDYYSPAYLPNSLHTAPLHNRLSVEEQALRAMSLSALNGEGAEGQNEHRVRQARSSLHEGQSRLVHFVPEADLKVPWIQSAYMTRRRSESIAPCIRNSRSYGSTVNGLPIARDRSSLQQQRRRPVSDGAACQSLDPLTLASLSSSKLSRSRSVRLSRRSSASSESHSSFQPTFIPQSLLCGPPPPPLMMQQQPRQVLVSPSTVTTSPSSSPILIVPTIEGTELSSPTSTGSESLQEVPELSGNPDFTEYRFPDEQPPPHPREGSSTAAARQRPLSVIGQRNIHPLSPFHRDFQHPDDLYNPSVSSPNDSGHANLNMAQNGKGSRRENRYSDPFGLSSISSAPTTASKPPIMAAGTVSRPVQKKRAAPPGLKIDTALKFGFGALSPPPPEMPLPALPPTPFTANRREDAPTPAIFSSLHQPCDIESASRATAAPSGSTVPLEKDGSKGRQQPTPTSTDSVSKLPLHEDPHQSIPAQQSNGTTGLQRRHSRSSHSHVVECSKASLPPIAGSSAESPLSRQRALALATTPIPRPARPLTVSGVNRSSRAAR